ncbi:GAF domain-containing protein [Glycomyces xiaoerkulensis]|uniref:GAF domain-containing protein n=1 Tax=Glycomyces xiaoerkulensis TaxID=2038139 RepID=UPI000C260D19|nr:GAF domain-containing protein [Glycomyces xiaoerkulensis]
MSDHQDFRLTITPDDPMARDRVERLRKLGIDNEPDPEFDGLARELTEVTGAPYAMVNFIDEEHQYFAGLAVPAGDGSSEALAGAEAAPDVGREMDRDHGYCPHVVVRQKALVLGDVCDYPRFAGNPVVDKIGIRSYLGAPLIDDEGNTLGTVCVVDTEVHDWGRPGLEIIKDMAAKVMDHIRDRSDQDGREQTGT